MLLILCHSDLYATLQSLISSSCPKSIHQNLALTKPTGGDAHSQSVSLVNLVVVQTMFQSSIIRFKRILAKTSLVEAHSEGEKLNKFQAASRVLNLS